MDENLQIFYEILKISPKDIENSFASLLHYFTEKMSSVKLSIATEEKNEILLRLLCKTDSKLKMSCSMRTLK